MNLNKEQLRELTELRQFLHRNPELSGKEINTQTAIRKFLEERCESAEVKPIAETGLLVTFNSGKFGKNILLRCDTDALPIDDEIEAAYKSVNIGVGHKCGHDGHTAIMCGVAMNLQKNPPLSGVVSLLFQPAEENGEGAVKCLPELKREKYNYDFVFALHNIPGVSLGKILWKSGTFTPAVISVAIQLKGKSSHAAEPWNGINPSVVFGEIISTAHAIQNITTDGSNNNVITPVFAKLGSRDYGISPGKAEIHFTIRSVTNENLQRVLKKIESNITDACTKNKIEVSFSYFQKFESIENHPAAAELIRKSANELGYESSELENPYSWGEDFGVFTTEITGAMFGIGSGNNCTPLHSTTYDFPDELIPYSINMFTALLRNASV